MTTDAKAKDAEQIPDYRQSRLTGSSWEWARSSVVIGHLDSTFQRSKVGQSSLESAGVAGGRRLVQGLLSSAVPGPEIAWQDDARFDR